MRRKAVSLVLAFMLVFSLLPIITASAAGISVKVAVEPTLEFDEIWEFSGGLSTVTRNGKMGLVDKSGKVVVPFEYDTIIDFKDNITGAEKDGKCGCIDKAGNVVIPFEYDSVGWFIDGLAQVAQNDKWGFIDKTGSIVVPLIYDSVNELCEGLVVAQMGEKFGYIDKSNNVVIPFEYDIAFDFSEGRATVVKSNGTTDEWGFIDKSGKIVIPIKYVGAGEFVDGLAWAVSSELMPGDEDKNYSMFYINKSGDIALHNSEWWNISTFSEGYALVWYADDTIDYIDITGKGIAKEDYIEGLNFSNGLAAVLKPDVMKWGFIDKSGNTIVPFEYDEVDSFHEGVAWVKKDGKWGILQIDDATEEPIADYVASPTTHTVYINGESVDFDAYNIAGNNYFKLRDLAFALSGTEKQFDVKWIAETETIELIAGRAYTPVGGEMAAKGSGYKQAFVTQSEIFYYPDGEANEPLFAELQAYNIEGNNYFKLRDIGIAFDFEVDWDSTNNAVIIDTTKSYTAD